MPELIQMKLADIKPYERNPRRNDDSVQAVANSIKAFGFRSPIIVDAENVIIAGHTRYKAAKKLRLKTVPVIVADDMTPEQVEAYRIADNSAGSKSDWDLDLLAEILPSLDYDLADFGLDIDLVSTYEDRQTEIIEDDAPEPDFEKEATVKRGEIWKLGDHYLMCGDASAEGELSELISAGGGAKSNMTFTDPPYGVAIGDKNKLLQTIQPSERITENIKNDNIEMESLQAMLCGAFINLRNSSADDAAYYVCSPQGGDMMGMMEMLKDAGLPVRHIIIWAKNAPTFSMGRLDYDYKHEPILYTWGKTHNYYGGGENRTSLWQFDKVRKCDLHPTMKPVALVAEAIKNSSVKGDIITDIFGGSGTTLVACEQLERKCRMMEIDPHYCDTIIERWENLTGKKAERVRA
jgi:site-specific DNA-methyltransferase (adenine-specific)